MDSTLSIQSIFSTSALLTFTGYFGIASLANSHDMNSGAAFFIFSVLYFLTGIGRFYILNQLTQVLLDIMQLSQLTLKILINLQEE